MIRLPSLAAALAVLPACGDAAGVDYAPPLAELRGVITASEIPSPAEVRVAFAWRRRDPDGRTLRVTQDVGVRAEFPVRFALAVTRLPPQEALNNGTSGAFLYATGTIIVYEDRNQNRTLDLLATDAVESPDRVLGAPSSMSIFYAEGTVAPKPGTLGPHPGFNLRREAMFRDPAPGAEPCAPVMTARQEYLPLDTEIPLTLTAAPELSRQICERTLALPPGPSSGAVPRGPEVTCASDGSAFVWKHCDQPVGLCASSTCTYQCGRRPVDEPPPPDWPCP
jgi:hypothetical protein